MVSGGHAAAGATAGAVLHIAGRLDRRALTRFLRRLSQIEGAPAVVIDDGTGAAPAAPPFVADPERVLARTLGVGRGTPPDGPTCTLVVEGRRVWEHHGRRRGHLPDPAIVAERARALRPFPVADAGPARRRTAA